MFISSFKYDLYPHSQFLPLLFNENSLIVQDLLSSYYILGTVVGTPDTKMNNT